MALVFSLIFFISSVVFAASSGDFGFTVELIHRDSHKSPMYNPSESHYHRLANNLRRSIHRHTTTLSDTTEAPISNIRGEYLMNISFGTPPFPIMASVDTGSDIVWTQCKPCPNCYQQDEPMFDPSKSSSYKTLPCSSPKCSYAGQDQSCSDESVCLYSISYGDSSHSKGDLVVETVTLGSTSGRPAAFPRIVIGCGHENGGTLHTKGSGIIGLGYGPASLVSQMGPASGGKFSYCLAPIGPSQESSKLRFGSNVVVSDSEVVSTPFYSSDQFKSFYLLNLQTISVGEDKIDFPTSSIFGEATIIIDSGTTLTILPPSFYTDFTTAISKAIDLKRTGDPYKVLEYCFKTTSDDYEMPSITAHFEGADVHLGRENIFVRLSDDVTCLAFKPGQDQGFAIYGNLAQQNFLVGYDVENKSVSFKPANCSAI